MILAVFNLAGLRLYRRQTPGYTDEKVSILGCLEEATLSKGGAISLPVLLE